MKFLPDNTINAVSLTTGTALSAWPVTNIVTEQPRNRLIGSATTIVVRATLTGASTAFFVGNWMASSGTYSVDGGGAVAWSAAQLENQYGFNPWGRGSTQWQKSQFVTISGSSTLDLSLTTSTDFKALPLNPVTNAIANWRQDAGATGRFEDSANAIVNVAQHGQVLLGGWATIGGSEYQIIKIIGDGTSSASITLSATRASATCTVLKHPVELGILRVGTATEVNNASSLSRGVRDFSSKSTGPNGSYQTLLRNVAQTYGISSIWAQAQADNLVGIANARRGLPLPIEVLSSMPAERNSFAIYGSISNPEEGYIGATGSHRDLSFQIIEAL
tara:strand:+ start:823 stop:1818 length:996 start_codon:yes stop_codon:yes gene_type:complete